MARYRIYESRGIAPARLCEAGLNTNSYFGQYTANPSIVRWMRYSDRPAVM